MTMTVAVSLVLPCTTAIAPHCSLSLSLLLCHCCHCYCAIVSVPWGSLCQCCHCYIAQDIDAIFALLRDHLVNKDVGTPGELEAAIREALKSYSLPIVIKHVDATLDYIKYYEKHIDKTISGFGYSEFTAGFHCFRVTPAAQRDSDPTIEFKEYQQDDFFSVAIKRTDLPPPWPEIGNFRPQPIAISNAWCPSTLMLSYPTGKLDVAPILAFDYEKALTDALHVLPDHAGVAAQRTEWASWIAARPRPNTQWFYESNLPQWNFAMRPSVVSAPANGNAPGDPRAPVGGVPVTQIQRGNAIRSSANPAPANQQQERQRRDAIRLETARAAQPDGTQATREPLVPSDWAFTRMNYLPPAPGETRGCEIPWILVQLPVSFDGVDTTAEDAKIRVKWFVCGCGFHSFCVRARAAACAGALLRALPRHVH